VTGSSYWDSQAATFDDQPDHGLRDPQVRDAWLRLLLAHLPAAPAAVADLGCGTGSLAVLLAAAGYTVTGLDSAPDMVRAARAKAAAAGVGARFVTGDAAAPALPGLPPGSFNAVLSRHVLWAMPDADSALAAWLRLLQPGGVLVLIEGRWHTGAGLTAADASRAVLRHRAEVVVTALEDPLLWGGPVSDERYLLVSPRLALPSVPEPGAAELDGGRGDTPPERPDGRRDPQLDARFGVPVEKVADVHPIGRVHLLAGDPVTADRLVRAEGRGGQPVRVQTAGPHALQPAGLDDVDPGRGRLAEEALHVLRRRGGYRPYTSSRAVAREPEHRRVPRVDRPDERRRAGIGRAGTRPELAEGRVLAKVPQGERTLSRIGWRGFASQQGFGIFGVRQLRSSDLGAVLPCTIIMNGGPSAEETMALFMVVEHYTHGPGPVYARAAERGRMLPDGLSYLDSWVVAGSLDTCFQLMETDDPALFDVWVDNWLDLVAFEIYPVVTSAEVSAAQLTG